MPIILPFLLLFLSYTVLLIQWGSLAVVLTAVAGILMVLLLAPGGMLLLNDSFVRHSRVLIYFGPLLTSIFLQLFSLSANLKRPAWRLGVLPLVWLMVVMSYAYGHAFAEQARFEQGRLSRIIGAASVLRARDSDQNLHYLIVKGVMPRSPVLQNTIRKFPLIDRLISSLTGWVSDFFVSIA